MKANEVNLSRFLDQQKTQFVIPVYQRNYDWNEQQCKQLLLDILAVGKDRKRTAHFLGSIVYIHDDIYSSTGIRELTIIDGQQRITTVMLIYIAIYTLAKELNDEALRDEINETYLINKFAREEQKLKLKPTENNDKAFKYLLRSDPPEEYSEYSRIIDNYKYFKTRITKDNLKDVRNGLDKLIFVEISLERGKDEPQRIFESLNSTGLALSQADLIRNYILMGLDSKKQLKIYRDFWQHIEEKATDELNNINRVSDFIRNFLTIEKRKIPSITKIYEEFKSNYSVQMFEESEGILAEIKKFAFHYNKLINPHHEPDREIQEQIKLINRLEINVSYPFLLKLYDDYMGKCIDKHTFIEVLETIQSYVWRRFIMGLPTNSLNKIFMRLHEDVNQSSYLASVQKSLLRRKGKQRFPNNRETIEALKGKDIYSINNKNLMYFLDQLENYQNHERVVIDSSITISIEHIFPQNPDPQWKRELGEQECNDIKEKYLHTIANLTLSGNNGALGNQSFQEKRDMNKDGKEQGYKFSRLWLNRFLASIDKWDSKALEQRFQLIAERFLKIWKYPDISIDEESDYDEVNIFAAEDPTSKRLAYVIFFDEKLAIKQVTKLYTEVIKTLFNREPERFFITDLGRIVKLTNGKDSLHQPVQISEIYYIESKYNSATKFELIKQALSVFDAEDELLIKYAKEQR